MNILSICNNPDVLKIMIIIKILVNTICIGVPIILMVVLLIDFMKAISDNDNERVQKALKKVPYRVIAVIFVFFAPTIIKVVVDFVDGNDDKYYSCISNASWDGVNNAYITNASNSINNVKESFSYNDYYIAKNNISMIKDEDTKNKLNNELESIKEYIDIKSDIDKLTISYNRKDYNALYEKINNIKDENVKIKLITLAEEIKGQKPLNITSGSFQKKFTGSKDWLDYWEFIPNNPTTNMPIVIFLHGDGEVSNINAIKNLGFIRGTKAVYGDDFPYIVLQPNRRSQRWQYDNVMVTVKELIDETCDKYLCDNEHIIITGMSGGAVGVWSLVSKYADYFSCAVPVSCPGYVNVQSYKNVPVSAYVGGASDDYGTYYWSMYHNVKNINDVWGNATLEVVKGGTHSSTYHTVYSRKEVIEWMLEQ